jgi:hypothetical protein
MNMRRTQNSTTGSLASKALALVVGWLFQEGQTLLRPVQLDGFLPHHQSHNPRIRKDRLSRKVWSLESDNSQNSDCQRTQTRFRNPCVESSRPDVAASYDPAPYRTALTLDLSQDISCWFRVGDLRNGDLKPNYGAPNEATGRDCTALDKSAQHLKPLEVGDMRSAVISFPKRELKR